MINALRWDTIDDPFVERCLCLRQLALNSLSSGFDGGAAVQNRRWDGRDGSHAAHRAGVVWNRPRFRSRRKPFLVAVLAAGRGRQVFTEAT